MRYSRSLIHSQPIFPMSIDYDYKRFFDLSPDLVCIADFDGYFKRVNPAAITHLGYPEEELYRHPIDHFVHEEDREITTDSRRRMLANGYLINFENRYVSANGETIWLSWTSQPVPEEGLVFGIARPVTHRKRLELQTQDLLEHLAGVNDQLKEFSLIASHDLRSPLGSLMGVFDLLDLESIPESETRELLQILKSSGEKLTETLNRYVDLLSQGLDEEKPRHPTPLEPTLNRVITSIQSTLDGKETRLVIDHSPEVNGVLLHPSHLESLCLNMLTNAVRYARPGVPPEIHFRSERVGEFVRISFSDNGQGIDLESDGDRLFQLHETFHNHPDSKGVGLYLVHRMVKSAGGRIEVESEPGMGTTFVITLPSGG